MILQVFENQTLRIGHLTDGISFTESHYKALARFAVRRPNKYFQLLPGGVRFSHYVGALQIGNLTIEILPKADKKRSGDARQWHDVLLEMLQVCNLLKIESQGTARLKLRCNSILELYFSLFVDEVNMLLRKGLLKSYHLKNERLTVLKGRIDFPKQLARAHHEETHFYTRYQRYEYDHLLNQIIFRALTILDRLIYTPFLKESIQALLRRFPKVTTATITAWDFQKISDQRKAKGYQKALDIAKLIILNYSPDIRGGRHDLLAILFDMNLLFEEYVFRVLQNALPTDWGVSRQVRRPFWKRRMIRPDILLEQKDSDGVTKRYVLDTKWKILTKPKPSIEELKQMYVYCQYFNARESVLLYPQSGEVEDLRATPYLPVEGDRETYYCQVLFLDVLKEGKLNRNLAKAILQKIIENENFGGARSDPEIRR